MKVMVVGGGGREHAIIKKLKESEKITEIFALPGNGGIAADATCVYRCKGYRKNLRVRESRRHRLCSGCSR